MPSQFYQLDAPRVIPDQLSQDAQTARETQMQAYRDGREMEELVTTRKFPEEASNTICSVQVEQVGMAHDIPATPINPAIPAVVKPHSNSKTPNTTCSSCYMEGHSRKSNISCPLNLANQMRRAQAEQVGMTHDIPATPVDPAIPAVVLDLAAVPLARRPFTQRLMTGVDTRLFRHYINAMISCKHCKALVWLQERISSSPKKDPLFSICCCSGQVVLPSIEPEP
ncbi:hypothetical protein BGX26_005883 [Mortierella sp. AD094]|nr:hypothetical protein BGX26_005883 [Mortierella sp. AD094]